MIKYAYIYKHQKFYFAPWVMADGTIMTSHLDLAIRNGFVELTSYGEEMNVIFLDDAATTCKIVMTYSLVNAIGGGVTATAGALVLAAFALFHNVTAYNNVPAYTVSYVQTSSTYLASTTVQNPGYGSYSADVAPGASPIVSSGVVNATVTPALLSATSVPCDSVQVYNAGSDDVVVGPPGQENFLISSGKFYNFDVANVNELSVKAKFTSATVTWIAT